MLETKQKTAMLGGTFDPIHRGHLFLLDVAIKNTDYTRFVLIPASLSNFKQNAKPSASDAQRLEMSELALMDFKDLYGCPDNVSIEVSDIEIARGGVSYTYDTVMDLKKRLNLSDRLGLIMGDDHVGSLEKWNHFEKLKDQVEFIICRREKESHWEALPQGITYKKVQGAFLSPESSTAFRNKPGEAVDFLSPRVSEYVRRKGLYV